MAELLPEFARLAKLAEDLEASGLSLYQHTERWLRRVEEETESPQGIPSTPETRGAHQVLNASFEVQRKSREIRIALKDHLTNPKEIQAFLDASADV